MQRMDYCSYAFPLKIISVGSLALLDYPKKEANYNFYLTLKPRQYRLWHECLGVLVVSSLGVSIK